MARRTSASRATCISLPSEIDDSARPPN